MSEPIERTDAALRQIENHARAARADLAALRRSPPAPAIDVEALAREYLAAHDAFQATDAGSEEDAEPQEWIDASMRYVKASEALRAALGGKEQR